ncbi:MAG: hypothetical protein QGF34_04990 [Candidatus Poseidoniaceae archaeon]|nr:hypothetical protein [Candidatus Poseidoniaceae archaeon]
MTRLVVVGVLAALMLSVVPVTHAAEIRELETGILFGGLHGMANETIAVNSTLDDLPTIAEDYTATWCGNCVEVGDALETVAENISMEIYAVHRNIYETQDPLGNENVDARFRDRYDIYAPEFKPPVAGINGKFALRGSNPVGDSLESDFADLASEPRNLGDGFVTMAWTPTGENSGTVVWSINQSTTAVYNVSVWMVEKVAYFPDGTNNQIYYHHIVREIIDVGTVNDVGLSSGTKQITYADAYDDDDLEVHIMFHEYIEQPEAQEDTPTEPDTEDTPFLSMPLTILALLVVAHRRQNQ